MSTRRDFIKQLTAAAGLGVVASMGIGLSAPQVRAALGNSWHMPDENELQERIFLAFAASAAVWDDWATPVNNCIALLAKTIAKYQPVTVLCRANQLALAKSKCGTTNIKFLTMPLDDVWVRDYGGCFVVDGQGGRGLVDFNFNGWGGKQTASNDTQVADALSYETYATYIASQLTGEGGGIEVDGHGTAIITESCWVNSNRNPGMSKAQIEAELKANLGLRKIIWLPGIKGKDITDAHVDFYARFASKGVVIANLDNDPKSYDYAVTRTHLNILKAATDADGNKLVVHTLPPPLKKRSNVYTQNNPDFAPGYINYLPINGAVIVPQFGDSAADKFAKDLLAKLYPGRVVVQVNIDPIAGGGGGIHCVTKNMPAV
ncbi:MAG: agmatine/peptidylarginine deiminase [Gammaproteobacteria bacterium]|jgi:agmatine deiminase|uniref:agmatine deiminase family protein n=1 Tax=unclassified Pseudomonas TaxID=196821 RepID=UPI0012F13D26|nr:MULTISPECIES: agmatine deiminase family protein [unclassified Pseudomonas]VXC13971.1 Agmatine deiminase [Pseudomonas sp. 9AZ]